MTNNARFSSDKITQSLIEDIKAYQTHTPVPRIKTAGCLSRLTSAQYLEGLPITNLNILERESGIPRHTIFALEKAKASTIVFQHVASIAHAFRLPSVAPVLGLAMPVSAIATWPVIENPIKSTFGSYSGLEKQTGVYIKALHRLDTPERVSLSIVYLEALLRAGVHVDDLFQYRFSGSGEAWYPKTMWLL